MTNFTAINGSAHKFKLIFRQKDFGRMHDLVIAIVPRWGRERIIATIAPFGLLAPHESVVDADINDAVATVGGAQDDGLGSDALVQAFMDYGWDHGYRPAMYRKMQHGSVRWHLRVIWRLLWGPPK